MSFASRNQSVRVWAVAFAVMVLGSGQALAQGRIHRIPEEVPPHYVLTAAGSWGSTQDQAVIDALGTVLYRHAETGIGFVDSSDPDFLARAMQSGAFSGGSADIATRWENATPFAAGEDEGVGAESVNPLDEPYFKAEWDLGAIDAPGAWALGLDGEGVRVAVLDGGICADHADLAGNLDLGACRSFVAGKGFDQDKAGFRHACHVAGIVAAADNAIGTVGVAPKATVFVCKVLDGGFGTFESILEGILYAATPLADGGGGADIMVISPATIFDKGGAGSGTGELISAFNTAVNFATSHNVLVVAAAGDEGLDLDHSGNVVALPGSAASAIAISATGPVGYAVGYPNGATNFRRPASYTNFGSSAIWIAAPGGDDVLGSGGFCSIPKIPSGNFTFACDVFDMVPGPGFVSSGKSISTWGQGTSVAAAHVAGVAALVKQRFPGISVGQLKTQLKNSADQGLSAASDPYLGHGFLNARRAVSDPLAVTDAASKPDVTPLGARGITPPGLRLAVAPHPVRGDASFTLTLPQRDRARLELLDVSGRRRVVIYDGFAAAGRTTVTWDGRATNGQRLEPGAYFAKLVSGSAQTRTLVIVER